VTDFLDRDLTGSNTHESLMKVCIERIKDTTLWHVTIDRDDGNKAKEISLKL
jgi:hypothetical protein